MRLNSGVKGYVLACQTQSRKRRNTEPCPLYLAGDTPTFTQRSANGWPPRSHSLSIKPSNLGTRIVDANKRTLIKQGRTNYTRENMLIWKIKWNFFDESCLVHRKQTNSKTKRYTPIQCFNHAKISRQRDHEIELSTEKWGESERVKKESDITRIHRISQVDTGCNYLSHTLWLCVQTV